MYRFWRLIALLLLLSIWGCDNTENSGTKRISKRRELGALNGGEFLLEVTLKAQYEYWISSNKYHNPYSLDSSGLYLGEYSDRYLRFLKTMDTTLFKYSFDLSDDSTTYLATVTFVHNNAKMSINHKGEKSCDPILLKRPSVERWLSRGPKEIFGYKKKDYEMWQKDCQKRHKQ